MTDNELILALSDMFDKKIEPLKKEMVTFRQEIKQDMAEFKQEIRKDMAEFKQDVNRQFADVRQDIVSINLNIENNITPKIDMLVENYVPAAKQYIAKTNEIAAMQDDIILLRKVVTEHSKKLQEIG